METTSLAEPQPDTKPARGRGCLTGVVLLGLLVANFFWVLQIPLRKPVTR